MEKGAENPSLATKIVSEFQSALSGIGIEICENGDKTFVVCDYEPVPIPMDGSNKKGREAQTSKQVAYQKFYDAYKQIKKTNGLKGINISSKGFTDLFDVCQITLGKEKMFLMSRMDFEKLQGKPLTLKNEKIKNGIDRWKTRNPSLASHEMEQVAAEALSGEIYGNLVAVVAGLKPMANELPVTLNSSLRKIVESLSPSIKIIKGLQTDTGPIDLVYKPQAVKAIIKENPSLFASLGFPALDPENIISALSQRNYGLATADMNHEKYQKRQQAFGLLLGYDLKSCLDFGLHRIDWSKVFMQPDHPAPHPMTANPFNFYGVDYAISNPDTNQDYQSLKLKHEKLVERVEELLAKGLSPLETLKSLNEDYEKLNNEKGEVVGTIKRAIKETIKWIFG